MDTKKTTIDRSSSITSADEPPNTVLIDLATTRTGQDCRTPESLLELVELCEEHEQLDIAFKILCQGARDFPQHAAILYKLATCYGEQGDGERRSTLLERLLEVDPCHREALEDLVSAYGAGKGSSKRIKSLLLSAAEHGLDTATLSRLEQRVALDEGGMVESIDRRTASTFSDSDIRSYFALFGGRIDKHARQSQSREPGGVNFIPVQEPLTLWHVRKHLEGEETFGIYPLRTDDSATMMVFVLHNRNEAGGLSEANDPARLERQAILRSAAARIENELTVLRLPPLVERNGSEQVLFWILFDSPRAIQVVDTIGSLFLELQHRLQAPAIVLEYLPKAQTGRKKEIGRAVKLPLGKDQQTGESGCFLDQNGEPIEAPSGIVSRIEPISAEILGVTIQMLEERTGRSTLPEIGGARREILETKASRGEPKPEPKPPPKSTLKPKPNPNPVPPPRSRSSTIRPCLVAESEKSQNIAQLVRSCPVLESLCREALTWLKTVVEDH